MHLLVVVMPLSLVLGKTILGTVCTLHPVEGERRWGDVVEEWLTQLKGLGSGIGVGRPFAKVLVFIQFHLLRIWSHGTAHIHI